MAIKSTGQCFSTAAAAYRRLRIKKRLCLWLMCLVVLTSFFIKSEIYAIGGLLVQVVLFGLAIHYQRLIVEAESGLVNE